MNTGQQGVHSLGQRVSKEWVRRVDRHRNVVLLLIYFVTGSILYANSMDNSFHYDDKHAIFQDEKLHGIPHFLDLWTTALYSDQNSGGEGHYRPLVLSTYLLNYSTGGLDPRGYHAVNILIHILAAFLVTLVMDQLTGRWVVGALSGLLFLVHPFNAEAVNYVTARSSQLYALFYLLSFYAYLRYRSYPFSPENSLAHPPPCPLPSFQFGEGNNNCFPSPCGRGLRGGGAYFWLGLSLLSFVLSMLSKEMAVTLPVTLFLYEWFLGYPTKWADRLRRLWIPAGFGIVVIASYLLVRRILSGAALPSEMGRNLMSQLYTEGVVLVKTLGLVLWPANLTIDHRVESYNSFAAWPVAGASLVLVGLMVFVLWWGRSTILNRRLCAFLLAWFFVALSPLMVLRLNAMLQENRAYLAVAGIAGLAGMGLVWLLDWARSRDAVLLKGVWSGILLLVLMSAVLTIQRNRVWQDELSLWTDAVQKAPYSSRGLGNLGVAYERAGQLDQAIELYQKSWTIKPDSYIVCINIGHAVQLKGHLEEAVEWYRRAIRLAPRFAMVYYHLGHVFEQQNRWGEAVGAYQQVIRLDPKNIMGQRRLTEALVHAGNPDEAAKEYETLMKMGINDSSIEAEVRTPLRQIQGKNPDSK